MQCPYCNASELKVTDKRDSGSEVRRRRECLKCNRRFTTYERVELDLGVIKKNGKREKFSREKLFGGLVKALEKRRISGEKIDKLIEDIEARVYRTAKDKDISSSKIGDIVMAELKKLDKVAYIRFAAVYRDFGDLNEFREEIRRIK